MKLVDTVPKQTEAVPVWDELSDSERIVALLDLVSRLSRVTEQLVNNAARTEDRLKTLELS